MEFKTRFFELKEITPVMVQYTIFGVEPTDTEIQELMDVMDKVLAEKNRVASVYMLENMKFLKAEHRISLGNWIKSRSQEIRKRTVCVGYKTNGILGKIILNGIFLVQKPEFDYIISTNTNEIIEWVNAKLKSENLVSAQ